MREHWRPHLTIVLTFRTLLDHILELSQHLRPHCHTHCLHMFDSDFTWDVDVDVIVVVEHSETRRFNSHLLEPDDVVVVVRT